MSAEPADEPQPDRRQDDDPTEAGSGSREAGRAENRRRLVVEHVGFARHLARRYRDRGVAAEDLDQIAYLGLVKAASRFDPDRGAAFTTFAAPTIEGEIRRHFRDGTWAVRVPRSMKDLGVAVRRAAEDLSHDLGRSPRPAEIARHLGVETDDVVQALGVADVYRARSLDAVSQVGNSPRVPSEPTEGDDPGLRHLENRLSVEELIGILPDREREIVRLSFFEDMTQSQIGDRIGLSQMHVSRLLRKALATMRDASRAPDA